MDAVCYHTDKWQGSLPFANGSEAIEADQVSLNLARAVEDVLAFTPERSAGIRISGLGVPLLRRFQTKLSGKSVPGEFAPIVVLMSDDKRIERAAAQYISVRYRDSVIVSCDDPAISEINDYLASFIYHDGPETRFHAINDGNRHQPHYQNLIDAWTEERIKKDALYWLEPLAKRVIKENTLQQKMVILTDLRTEAVTSMIESLCGIFLGVGEIERSSTRAADDLLRSLPGHIGDDEFNQNLDYAVSECVLELTCR